MQAKLTCVLLCNLLLSCDEASEDQKKAAELAKQAEQPVLKIATAPDGTVLWKVRDTTTGGTSYVYFSSGGTTVKEGKSGIRLVPSSTCDPGTGQGE